MSQLAPGTSAFAGSEQRGSDRPGETLATFSVVTVFMLLAALVVAAGFAVVAQRRLRQLGMLASLGASVMGIWSITTVDAADSIQRQRSLGALFGGAVQHRLGVLADRQADDVARAGEIGELALGPPGDGERALAQAVEPDTPAQLVDPARRLRSSG